MNLLYCGDKNIEDGLYISILSFLKNIEEELNIYVLTINMQNEKYDIKGISDSTIDFLDRRVKVNNPSSFVKKLDITRLFEEEIPLINMDTRFTPCCMLRLFADEIEELPDRILYLDNDVVCRKNCLGFYSQDISDFEMVGVLDHYGKWFFKNNTFKFDYLNSGVLLLNLRKIKETNLFKDARKLCQDKKMFMPDQSALNKLSKHKKIVDRKYNEQRKLQKDTILQHFTTSFRFLPWIHTVTIKPWNVEELQSKLKINEYDDIIQEYLDNKEKMKEEKEVVINNG